MIDSERQEANISWHTVWTNGTLDDIELDWSQAPNSDDEGQVRTRKQKKALDKEIPWREILRRDDSTVQAFCQAVRKEYSNWENGHQ